MPKRPNTVIVALLSSGIRIEAGTLLTKEEVIEKIDWSKPELRIPTNAEKPGELEDEVMILPFSAIVGLTIARVPSASGLVKV